MKRIATILASPAFNGSDTALRVSANPQPRGRLAGFLRRERKLLANPRLHQAFTADL